MKYGAYRCKICKKDIYVSNDDWYSDYATSRVDIHNDILEHIMECQFEFISESWQ